MDLSLTELVRLAHPYIPNGFFLVGTEKGGSWRSLGPQFLVGLSSHSFTKPEVLGLALKEQRIGVPVDIGRMPCSLSTR